MKNRPIVVEAIEVENESIILIPVKKLPDYIEFNKFDRIWTPEESIDDRGYRVYRSHPKVELKVKPVDGGFQVTLPEKMTGRLGYGYVTKRVVLKELDFGKANEKEKK